MVSPLRAFLFLSLCVGACRSDQDVPPILSRIKDGAKCRRFDSYLNGLQEVPPNETEGECKGLMRLNRALDELSYKIRCDGLSRKPFAAHIHQGEVGENGGVVAGLDLTGIRRGRVVDGIIRAADIGDDAFEYLIYLLFEDVAYFNIHTPTSPPGEVRGQIIPPSDCLEE